MDLTEEHALSALELLYRAIESRAKKFTTMSVACVAIFGQVGCRAFIKDEEDDILQNGILF